MLLVLGTLCVPPPSRFISGQTEIQYIYKQPLVGQNINESVSFDKSVQASIFKYHNYPLANTIVYINVSGNFTKFSLYFQARELNVLYSQVNITLTENSSIFASEVGLLAVSSDILTVTYSTLDLFSNCSSKTAGLAVYVKGQVSISHTKIYNLMYGQDTAGLIYKFFGANATLVACSVMSAMEFTGNNSAVLFAITQRNAVGININKTTISGYMVAQNGIEEGSMTAVFVGDARGRANITLANSIYCVQGDYVNEICPDGQCDLNQVSNEIPDPLTYIRIKGFINDTNETMYGYTGVIGNNTDYEVTNEIQGQLNQSKNASLFKDQYKFFNIKISGYDIEISAKYFSIFTLKTEEVQFNCITIRFVNSTLQRGSTILMLQQQSNNVLISKTRINSVLLPGSYGRYVGFAETIPKDAKIRITNSSIEGQYYSHEEATTLGISTAEANATIDFEDFYVSISKIRHGGYSSIIMNNITDVKHCIFQNVSFNVNNTADAANFDGPRFGGFCQYALRSTFNVSNCEIAIQLYFQGGFVNSGILVGHVNESDIRLENITLQGSATFTGVLTRAGLVGNIQLSDSIVLRNISTGTQSTHFKMSYTAKCQNIGVVGNIENSNIQFTETTMYYDIDAPASENLGFLGYSVLDSRLTLNYSYQFRHLSIYGFLRGQVRAGILAGFIKNYEKNETSEANEPEETEEPDDVNQLKDIQGDFQITVAGPINTGMIGRMEQTRFNARNVSITSRITNQTGNGCIGVVAGIIRRKSYVTFENYTGNLDANTNSGTGAMGGLVGEMSLDITECVLRNSTLYVRFRGIHQNSWGKISGMMGWLANATIRANDVSISIDDDNHNIPLAVGQIAYPTGKGYSWTVELINVKSMEAPGTTTRSCVSQYAPGINVTLIKSGSDCQ